MPHIVDERSGNARREASKDVNRVAILAPCHRQLACVRYAGDRGAADVKRSRHECPSSGADRIAPDVAKRTRHYVTIRGDARPAISVDKTNNEQNKVKKRQELNADVTPLLTDTDTRDRRSM